MTIELPEALLQLSVNEDNLYAFDNESTGTIGFRNLTLGDFMIAKTAAPFMSYDFLITGRTTFGDIGRPFPTPGTSFILSSITAMIDAGESSSLALPGAGLLALGFIWRCRTLKLARA